MRTLAVGASLAAIAGCTTLGPIPATTTVSAVPEQRPDVEVQLAAAPGYYLSSAVVEDPQGVAIAQLSAVFEPARLVPVPGLIIGARLIGPEGDTQLEPIVGVRRALGADRRVALAGLAYGTHGEASRDDASYAATRVGGELAVDVRVLDETRFAESLQSLGVVFDPTNLDAAQLAGRLFSEYRREGGPRGHLIPAFLIGAHAQQQADRIAARDRGYLRRYFPRLKILKPR